MFHSRDSDSIRQVLRAQRSLMEGVDHTELDDHIDSYQTAHHLGKKEEAQKHLKNAHEAAIKIVRPNPEKGYDGEVARAHAGRLISSRLKPPEKIRGLGGFGTDKPATAVSQVSQALGFEGKLSRKRGGRVQHDSSWHDGIGKHQAKAFKTALTRLKAGRVKKHTVRSTWDPGTDGGPGDWPGGHFYTHSMHVEMRPGHVSRERYAADHAKEEDLRSHRP